MSKSTRELLWSKFEKLNLAREFARDNPILNTPTQEAPVKTSADIRNLEFTSKYFVLINISKTISK
jgi:hypothetical protein